MKLSTKLLLSSACALAINTIAFAHDMIPGTPQKNAILIKGATLHTVANGVLVGSDILLENGKISAIGKQLKAPEASTIINAQGQHVYPGLILTASQLGLREIGAVRATVDDREVGEDNPHLLAHVAFNTDSEIVPTIRANGITHTQVTPVGRLIAGQSSLVNLDAWNADDALTKSAIGIHVNWPSQPGYWVAKKQRPKALEKYQEQLARLTDYFEQAQRYHIAYQHDNTIAKDIRWHAMVDLFNQNKTLFVHAEAINEIEQAMRFAKQFNLKMVLIGASDAWMVKEQLAASNIAVIYTNAFGLPSRSDEDIDQAFKTPSQLTNAGVTTAIGYESAWDSRSLAFAAGMAAKYGLGKEQALKAITLIPAQILGVADILGSLEVGKSASLVISQGDIMDYQGHKVINMFIDGRAVDLNNRHRQLYEKYQQKVTAN
ncbi:MAG: amidohydrolase family protein [Gammaproteobacteria bacterium]|nr:amidohydrolase family protein [Gammaproteobacteria bacterium]